MKIVLVLVALIFYMTAIVGNALIVLNISSMESEAVSNFSGFTVFAMLFAIVGLGIAADMDPPKPRLKP